MEKFRTLSHEERESCALLVKKFIEDTGLTYTKFSHLLADAGASNASESSVANWTSGNCPPTSPNCFYIKKAIRDYRETIKKKNEGIDELDRDDDDVRDDLEQEAVSETKKKFDLKDLAAKILVSYSANASHKESDQTNLAKMAIMQARIFRTVFKELGGQHINLQLDLTPTVVLPKSTMNPIASKLKEKEEYSPLEMLKLSPRTLNALINAGVGSIEQLTALTPDQIVLFRGFGINALQEVNDALRSRSMSLKQPDTLAI
jgi:DNA-directed RNA polymerase subunit alpha